MTELSEFPVHISSILGAVVHSGPKRNRTTYGTKNMGMGYGDHMEERKSAKNTIIEIIIIIIINMYLQVTIIKIIIIIII
jgi:hypothetical protein